MGRLDVEFSREAARQYRKLPGDYRILVDRTLRRLSEGSSVDLKPVEGRKDVYRIRVGRYRMLFTKLGSTVLVFRITPRGDAYRH